MLGSQIKKNIFKTFIYGPTEKLHKVKVEIPTTLKKVSVETPQKSSESENENSYTKEE